MKQVKVIKFYADWCGPCRMMKPIYSQLSEELDDVQFFEVNVDEDAATTEKYEVKTLPTIIVLEDDVEVRRHSGFMVKPQLQDLIKGD